MKQFLKYSCFVMLACLTALSGHARTVNIDVDAIRGDITKALRSTCEKVAISDTVVMNFGKGTYTINGTIQCRCHTVIKGLGKDKTTIILNKGNDSGGFKAFLDDVFFKVTGRPNYPVSLKINDLTIRLKEHKGIWWQGEARYAVKVYHADGVDIHDVDSYMDNAIITNYDFHVCSNVKITDCVISNFNNCIDGGNLWFRGELHNIVVKRNKFYKYGNDELLAVFDRVVENYNNGYVRGKATRSNIFIEDNEFYYGGYDKSDKNTSKSAISHMIVSLFTEQHKSNDRCTTRNFHVRNNKFYINDVCTRCMYINFNPADVHENITIENNEIYNAKLKGNDPYYRQDIEVNDLSSSNDTIRIVNNTVRNKDLVLTEYGTQGYSFLLMQGGNVELRGNKILNELTVDPKTGKDTGVQLIWCGADGGSVTMRDNVCKGLKFIATVGAGNGTRKFTLNAENNHFEGDTRIYCHKIEDLDLNFTRNTFVSSDMNFFLQEFASKGKVVFNYNNVTVKPGNGTLMTHWNTKVPTNAMRFNQLEVKGNIFKGVKNEKEMFKNMTNTRKRKVSNNTIRQ